MGLKIFLVVCIAVLGMATFTQEAAAQQPLCETLPWLQCAPSGPQSGGDIINIITNITNWLFIGFLVLAVIMIVLAAFQFLAAGGDPQAMGKARTKLFWAVIAVVIAVLAGGIPVAVKFIIGV